MLEKFGVDLICVKTFTKEFANLSARDYVEYILIDELNTKHIVIGYDHHFGKNREGTFEYTTQNFKDIHAELIIASKKDKITISSNSVISKQPVKVFSILPYTV